VSASEATLEKGGTYFGWFYTAANYIQAYPGLDDAGIEDVIRNTSEGVLAWVNEQGLKVRGGRSIDAAIKQYILEELEIDGQKIVAGGDHSSLFHQELNHYMTAKTKRKRSCSLCCSRFEAAKQEDQEVPFGPQRYSNKHPLGWRQVKRGVCPICRIELILRQIQQSGLDEKGKPVQLYLYPSYFFTLETERVAKSFLVEMADLNLFALRQHLRKVGFSPQAFMHFEGFMGDGPASRRAVRTPTYRENEPAGLVFASLTPLGRKPTDTDAWIIPTLLAVGIPLLLDVKVVATSSFVPIFPSGADFQETAVLDGAHAFSNHIWGRDRFRVDELEHSLLQLLNLYDLHLDVFGEVRDPHWPLISQVTQDVVTDPYMVFAYYERKPRRDRQDRQRRNRKRGQRPNTDGISQGDLEAYWRIYLALGGEENMGIIGRLVDAYAKFYRAPLHDPSSYAIVRPLDEAIQATVKSDPKTTADDLTLLVVGPLADVMERVWERQVDGFDPIVFATGSPLKRDERRDLSRCKQEAFIQLFLDEFFAGYCNGDRATLQDRQNRIRSAARFYYLKHHAKSTKKEDANG
jgi:CRISPR-associated protein Csc3